MTDWNAVWSELQITRLRAYAREDEEGQVGVSCVAIPVLRSGTPILSISISAPSERMSGVRTTQLAGVMRELIGARLPFGLSLPNAGGQGASEVRPPNRALA